MPERGLTLGTAGHIDHGKTTLVKALTGRDTDRLKEEKERGISIELGYAELALPSGRHLSVIDVPGHERFVKNMVAGATGIDLFLLVVAADDGVMPQTREHLRIIELLEIPLGCGGADQDRHGRRRDGGAGRRRRRGFPGHLALRRRPGGARERRHRRGSGRRCGACSTSWPAGRPTRTAYPATRMPIDRVFSLKGIGTVVTGTLWSGELRPEDTVTILPPLGSDALDDVRVRSIQVHDQQVEAAEEGQRVALNLTGVDREQLQRGQWVVKDPAVEPTYLADVSLMLLDDAPEPLTRVCRACAWTTAPRRSWPRWCWPTGRSCGPATPATRSCASRI